MCIREKLPIGEFVRVLLTGGGGYIGSVLSEMLLDKGFEVTVLDRFFFGKEALDHVKDRIRMVQGDIRWVEPSIMRGIGAVIDMAAMSNDPLGELNPKKTYEINYKGRLRMAKLAKKYKVERYILASSCSIYGFSKKVVSETTKANPLTTYSKANSQWENETLPLASSNFCVTALRQSSVYGPSTRMRFDISLNAMTLRLFKSEKLQIMRDGNQTRPFIHIKDTSNAFITVLKADKDLVNGEIFNVGSNDQNMKIFDLAKIVARSNGKKLNYEWYGNADYRSYVVNFDKIRKVLGYKTKYTPRQGAREMFKALESGKVKDDEKSITIKWYKKLYEMQDTIKNVEMKGKIL